MARVIIGKIASCFSNQDLFNTADYPLFSGHIEMETDEETLEIITDNPESYLRIATEAFSKTTLTLDVEDQKGKLHLCPI